MSKKQMNQAQQEAVAYVDGPLLIVAGAGTGKTTVITEKIHHIISSGLAKPEEILALTFTEKAAQEMQERVDMLLDTGYVDISISTFHAFCQKLIETYGLDIGVSNQPTLLTQIDAWLLMRKHLNTFELSYYRPMGNPNRHIHELLSHFSKCKDELITPEQYLTHAQDIALNKDSAEQNESSRLTELAHAYHRYNQLLLDMGAMDFGDLLVYSVKLLEERPQIKKQIQQRYKYILVDEFQDVNWAQYHLVHLLSEQSQLTVVGDDDQSIYAFRGASVSNILRFQEDYPTAKQIVLQENYRSGQKILDISYQSIQNNNPDRLEEKLHINKKLIAAGASYPGQVHHLHAATIEEEVRQVIDTIRQLKQDTDIAWHDIAILFRANSAAAPFMQGLEGAGIPYEYMASSGLFRQSIVLDCINFFISISDVHHNAALFRLLHIPSVSISDADIQQLIFGAKKKSISYYDALSRAGSFHVSEEGQKQYQQLLQYLHTAIQRARSEKPTTVLYQFLEESGYLQYLTSSEAAGNEDTLKQIQYLKQFFDFVSNYETTQPDTHVADIVEYYGHISEAGDDGKLYQPSDMRDAVNLLTIHASKGLEYRCVFVVNMVEDRFPSRARSEAIDIPLALVREQLPEGEYHLQEERRLFYVAMTRAKEYLYLTSADMYGGVRKKKISRFLAEIGYTQPQSISGQEETQEQETPAVFPYKKQALEQADETPLDVLYPLPKAFSFSQIRSYDTCPYQYKLAHILKIPMRGSASFSFGNTMHNTLQKFYQRIQEMNGAKQISLFGLLEPAKEKNTGIIVPSLEELKTIYKTVWIDDWYKDKRQREEYFKKGLDILSIFYATQQGQWTVPVALESWFKIKVGSYLIHGKIDRVDTLPDKTLNIIDYKTGQAKETLASEDKEQLLLYQIAAETLPEYRHIGGTSQLTFYYLNDNVQLSFIGKEKEKEKFTAKLEGILDNIHTRNFTATPDKYTCARCDFRDICEYRQ